MSERSRSVDRSRRRDSALLRGVAFLARREHSTVELRAKLLAKGFLAEEVELALDTLSARDLQSDRRFVEMLVRSRVQAGQGPARLRLELARHGLADLGEAALAEQSGQQDWLQRALAFARRRFPEGPRDARDERRLGDQLLRRGHSSAHVREVLAELRKQRASDASDAAPEFED